MFLFFSHAVCFERELRRERGECFFLCAFGVEKKEREKECRSERREREKKESSVNRFFFIPGFLHKKSASNKLFSAMKSIKKEQEQSAR